MLALALVVAAACAPTAAPTGAPPAQRPTATGPTGGFDHPAWKQLGEDARKEGTLVLAVNPNPEVREVLPRRFKERFGVDVEMVSGRSADILTRLQLERAAGQYTIDLSITGGDSGAQMYRDSWLDPIRPQLVAPEVLDPSRWREGRLPFLDPEDQTVLQLERSVNGLWLANPELVQDSELKTLDDLLAPKWRGKISMDDPTGAGLGQNNAVYVYVEKGEDFFRKLYVDQAPTASRDDRQLEDWLVRGAYPISFGLAWKNLDQMLRQGLPAKDFGLLDGKGWLRGPSIVLFNKAPHPAAAKLFLNWIASPEGLEVHAAAEQLVPTRKDVASPWAQPYQEPQEGVEYRMNADEFTFVTERKPPILQRIREIVASPR